MMDRIIPGGIRNDLSDAGKAQLVALIAAARTHFPELVELYDNTASLKDRTVGTGILSPALAQQFAAGGYVGRPPGRDLPPRRGPGHSPYQRRESEGPPLPAG